MGSEQYENAAEELKKDEKKLAVSKFIIIFYFFKFEFRILSKSKKKCFLLRSIFC